MQHNYVEDEILSLSLLLEHECSRSGSDGVELAVAGPIIRLLETFTKTLNDNAICKCYKLDRKNPPLVTLLDPSEAMKGIVSVRVRFAHNTKYQKNLLLKNEELNKQLLDYIESAIVALYAEEILSGKDINPEYKFNKSISSIVVIENNVINYSISTFPTFVKALGKLLKKLNSLDSRYSLLICNKTNHLFANGIETHAGPVAVEHDAIHEVIGRVIPVYKSTKLSHFVFIEHDSHSHYVLTSESSELSSILQRAANNEDPIKIHANLVEYRDRGILLPKRQLKLHDILTKTWKSREELAQSLKPLI